MNKIKSALLILFIALIYTNCRHKPGTSETNRKINPDINLEIPGTTRLFDGQTLDNWEITNFGPQGDVYVSDGEIVLGWGEGCTGITWKDSFPRVNYEVSLEAMRIYGIDFFCGMTFPVNEYFCSLIIGGWACDMVGLSTIDGFDGSENETTSMRYFNNDEWYRIQLRVSSEKIEAWINEEKVIEFPYKGRQLGIRPEVGLSRPFGIATWNTTGAIRNIYLKTSGPY